jgi:hypothetical protein
MSTRRKATKQELRKFGLVMTAPLAALAALGFWRDKPAWPYLAGLSAFFLLFGLLLPRALAPIEWAWMKLARAMGTVMTYVVLALAFYLVLTPVGLLLRVLGKRPVELGFDPQASTYWSEVEKDGIYDRADKPY